MNSVLQQLFMIRPLRSALLSVKIPLEFAADDETDEDDIRRDTVCEIFKNSLLTNYFLSF
jgi:hypothetical protein